MTVFERREHRNVFKGEESFWINFVQVQKNLHEKSFENEN